MSNFGRKLFFIQKKWMYFPALNENKKRNQPLCFGYTNVHYLQKQKREGVLETTQPNHPTIITSLFILCLCPLLYICYYFPYHIHQVFLSFLQTFLWTLFKCVYPLSSQFIHLILHWSVSLSTYISVSWHLSLHPSLPLHLHLLFHMALLSFQRGTVSSASEQPFLEVSRWF